MSDPRSSSVRIEPVSDLADVPILASIFDTAIIASGDNFRELLKRYVEDPYVQLETRLQAALSAPSEGSAAQHYVFKAVKTVLNDSLGGDEQYGRESHGGVDRVMPTEEVIVGMAHWTIGYIDLPKVDPFEQRATSACPAVAPDGLAGKAPVEEPIARSVDTANTPESEPEPSFDFYTVCRKPVLNTYISQIRGKKHVYLHRIAVHPDYQRRGIARQLLAWGLDRADSEKLVSYLNGRPYARRLYENAGFKTVDIVPMPVPGLEVPDMIVMVRQPQPAKGT